MKLHAFDIWSISALFKKAYIIQKPSNDSARLETSTIARVAYIEYNIGSITFTHLSGTNRIKFHTLPKQYKGTITAKSFGQD